jgi:hypothetical protein
MDKLLAVIYGMFSLLMLSSAIGLISAKMFIGAFVFFVLALGTAYLAFRRWRGKTGSKKQENVSFGQDHDAVMSAEGKEAGEKKSVISIITWILIAFIIAVIVIWLGSQIVTSRSNISYMESAAVPLIDALEKYKKVNGSYPDTLQPLQPDYISSLPLCSKNSARSISYFLNRELNAYYLNCYTGFYTQKHRYDSQSRKWESWD